MSLEEKARTLVDAFHKRGNTGLTQLEHDIAQALRDARADAIEECIQALGGRYGAAATRDIRSLKDKGGV